MDEKTRHEQTRIASALLTPVEAAQYLSISRTTLYELLRSRRLRKVQLGRCVRISRSELDRFISETEGY